MDRRQLTRETMNKNCFLRQRKKIIFSGAVYHITQRAPGKEQLFLEEADYLYALHLIKQISKAFDFEVFSFALMPNHLHLLLRINKENLSKGMKRLFETYAKFFNEKYARKGHVFCGNYRCAICLNDNYLLAASLYIHLNPVKANLVQNPLDYRWSSCAVFGSPMPKETFLNHNFILKIISEDINIACQIYKKLLFQSINIKSENILEVPFALENFWLSLYRVFKGIFKEYGNRQGAMGGLLDEVDLEEKIIELKKEGRLRSPSSLKARKFLIEQLKSRGFSISQISEMINLSRQSIYKTFKLTK